ncbi:MAG: hypothetical protein ACTTKN_05495 [Phocaeicola sp.]|uniref:hypothetical protein n=1 Tax=Phocaeicola TaxID=909656 RepID=UPI00234E936D|nr:hypothetical protein [Phocaeicola oris]
MVIIQLRIGDPNASLNAAINAMRPGNLPELEDLSELVPLIDKAKKDGKEDAKL